MSLADDKSTQKQPAKAADRFDIGPVSKPAKVACGDTLEAIELESAQGNKVHIANGSWIGMPFVLWIADAAPDPIVAGLFAQRLPDFEAVGANPWLVVRARNGTAVAAPSPIGLRTLLDPNRRVARAVGLTGPGVVVLDADGRVVSVRPGAAFGAALEDCTRIFERTAPQQVRAAAPALIVHDVLEPDLCRKLMDYWQAGNKLVDQVTSTTHGTAVRADYGQKRRADVHITSRALNIELRARINRRIAPQLLKAFHFELQSWQLLRVGCYDSAVQGRFLRHRDTTATPATKLRQFALTINLNTHEYEGGELWFPEFGRQLYKPDAGGAVVFSAELLHEALPVTSGRRFGIFGFFFDKTNAARRRALASRVPDAGDGQVESG